MIDIYAYHRRSLACNGRHTLTRSLLCRGSGWVTTYRQNGNRTILWPHCTTSVPVCHRHAISLAPLVFIAAGWHSSKLFPLVPSEALLLGIFHEPILETVDSHGQLALRGG